TGDGLGASVAAKYEQLLAAADASPTTFAGLRIDRAAIDFVATAMMYRPAVEWSALGRALADLAAGDPQALDDLFIADAGYGDDNAFSAYQTVWLQDMPLPSYLSTPSSYRAWAETQASAAPHVG